MTEVNDVPQLQELAERIPADIRARLSQGELFARVALASTLYAQAPLQEPDAAESTRLAASRVLTSLPIDDFLARLAYFNVELAKASAAENAAEAGRVFSAICRLTWPNVYPDEDALSLIDPKMAAEMEYGLSAPSRAARLPKARRRR